MNCWVLHHHRAEICGCLSQISPTRKKKNLTCGTLSERQTRYDEPLAAAVALFSQDRGGAEASRSAGGAMIKSGEIRRKCFSKIRMGDMLIPRIDM